jgi:hypothetical protein
MASGIAQARGSKRIAYGYVLYQLLASVLGAFAIAVFIEHFVHIDWHGLLSRQSELWGALVAPIQNYVFARLELWTGQRFEPFWRDYLTVGAVALLSFARATLAYDMSSAANRFLRWGELLLDVVQHMLLWPVAFVRAFLAVFEKDPEHAPYIVLLTLTPLVYLVILFGVNLWMY